jgi:hypothetical protein
MSNIGPPPPGADVTGSLNSSGIKSLEENAEENKKKEFLKWASFEAEVLSAFGHRVDASGVLQQVGP